MVCPDCQGSGQVNALIDYADRRLSGPRVLTCRCCCGSGEIGDEQAERRAAGDAMRRDRIARGLSQRQEAARLGIDMVDLNAREHGRETA